ncbi:MAG: DNA-processing protein DprA [Oscillospiraceae bacterium]|nr:DNA-processing protein DprA [Oscillospiraceae bacterium]
MLIYWIWLALKADISEQEKLAVLAHFGSPEDVYFAQEQAYSALEALRPEAVAALCDKKLEEAEKILGLCTRKKIRVLTWHDDLYPSRLKNIADPPLVLYYKGRLPDFDREPMIGVVGTREASAYGLSVARNMGEEIARCGGIVVSGMAAGIDAMATEGALIAEKPAVGVLGCGADRVYPTSNRRLYMKMEQAGCLLTEYPPGTPPYKWNFPRRNRIISGIFCGVLVIEAPEKSGALITARQALEQGRDVYVVPGNIGVTTCAGSNALLRDGAGAVFSGWDVVSEYAHLYPDKIQKIAALTEPSLKSDTKAVDNMQQTAYIDEEDSLSDLNQDERAILAYMRSGEQNIDELIAASGLDTGTVLAALTLLEVKGKVVTLPGRRVALC